MTDNAADSHFNFDHNNDNVPTVVENVIVQLAVTVDSHKHVIEAFWINNITGKNSCLICLHSCIT
jgi:hypothetical protein